MAQTGEPDRVRIRDAGPDEPGWLLEIDGVAHSHLDAADPTRLAFGYMRRIADLVDLAPPPGQRLAVVHLGGGAGALARYVAATRPGSRQVLVEVDPTVVAAVAATVPYRRGSRVRTVVADARAGLADLPPASADLVITDVFAGAQVPATVTSREFLADVRRLLRPGGWYALNIADTAPLGFARGQAATVLDAFTHGVLWAEPAVLRGRRWGNLVLAASDCPLPEEQLRRVAAGEVPGWRLVGGEDLLRFTGGARPVLDAVATPSPLPPRPVRIGRGW